jgi:hypothetical protein
MVTVVAVSLRERELKINHLCLKRDSPKLINQHARSFEINRLSVPSLVRIGTLHLLLILAVQPSARLRLLTRTLHRLIHAETHRICLLRCVLHWFKQQMREGENIATVTCASIAVFIHLSARGKPPKL